MGLTKEKPLYAEPTDIEDDLYAWSYEQAELLRHRRFAELDIPNLIEEIESMARRDRAALMVAYRVLIMHLLKWELQLGRRSRSWLLTIIEQRNRIETLEELNPSLARDAASIVERAFPKAVRDARAETGLPRAAFPGDLPYTLEQLRDADFMPGPPRAGLIEDEA